MYKIVIFLLLISIVNSEDFIYDIKVDKSNPYLKEPIFLTLELNQTNKDIVLLFNFDIKKSSDYSFQQLNTVEKDSYHNARVKYNYLIYPLKDGKIKIEFDLLKRVTNDDSVAYSFSGDRDNVKGLVTKDSKVALPPLELNIKPLPKNTLLVGDFNISYNIKKHQAKAYEPLAFQVKIDGVGYPPILNSILPKDTNLTIFKEKPIIKSYRTKHNIRYPMAISNTQSFILKPIIIKAFNPKTQKSYNLTIPKQKFKIEKVDIANLVDKTNSPPILKEDYSWLYSFLSYIVVFIAGYITAYSIKWKKKTIKSNDNPLKAKIEECKSEKELMQLLISTNSKRFEDNIRVLESALYKNGKIDLYKFKSLIIGEI
ncbi:hypothetical protein MNB_SV-15-745 [hydrothermal vent metagenome]|uniref:BatD n=1 Tax=hydrothermal vent metagenome TaxID=652676 RepID=A0A1W1EKY5_9ZZZZ